MVVLVPLSLKFEQIKDQCGEKMPLFPARGKKRRSVPFESALVMTDLPNSQ